MKRQLTHLTLTALAVFSVPLYSQAAVLASYDFTSGSSATTTASNLTAANAAWQGFSSNFGFSATTDTAFVRSDQTDSSQNLNEYIEFTLNADPDYLLQMDSFIFALGGSNSGGVNTEVFSSVRIGSPSADFSTLPNLTMTPGNVTTASHDLPAGTTPSTFSTYTVDLSDASFQNVDQLNFRLYVFDDVDSGTVFLRFNSMSAEGTVSLIPEPSTGALLVAGAVALVGSLRRRRAKR